MNTILLRKEKAVAEFYNISANKKRLESDNPVRGAFELAYFDTQRTLRGMGKNPNRKEIKQEIFEIVSNWYSKLSQNFESNSLSDYDGTFLIMCDKIVSVGEKYGHKIYFGQAQKIVNMFFKYTVIIDERLNCHLNYFHVPCDEVILNGIARSHEYSTELRAYAKACMPWSKMEDVKTYMQLQKELRKVYEIPIIFEFNSWGVWKK